MKKFITTFLAILSLLIFVFAISIMILGVLATKSNKPLYIFNYSVTAIPTPSMEGNKVDSLHVGDLAVIKKKTYSDTELGDIIVFQKQDLNILVIHRVIEITPNGLVTKGDNNASADKGFVTESDYQGTYVRKITNLKWLTSFIVNSSNKKYIFLAIIMVLFISLITEIIFIVKELIKKQKEDLKKLYENGQTKDDNSP